MAETPAVDQTTAAALTDRSKLIQTASLSSTDPDAASITKATATDASAFTATAADPAAAVDTAPPTAAPAEVTAPEAKPVVSPTPPAQKVASIDPTPDTSPTPKAAAAPVQKARSGVDINSASADALDRIGAGRIGQTIVAHRPYRSVQDLLHKRVLRTSDFHRIQSAIRVD